MSSARPMETCTVQSRNLHTHTHTEGKMRERDYEMVKEKVISKNKLQSWFLLLDLLINLLINVRIILDILDYHHPAGLCEVLS